MEKTVRSLGRSRRVPCIAKREPERVALIDAAGRQSKPTGGPATVRERPRLTGI